jgi:hypothetical protein
MPGSITGNPSGLCHTLLVQRTVFTRRAAAATLTAGTALAAHGGPALVLDPVWAAVAVLAALVVCLTVAAASRALAQVTTAPPPPPVWITAAILMAAQLLSHLALLEGGVHSGMAQSGALALHASVALLVALLLHHTDGALTRRLSALARALTESLVEVHAADRPGSLKTRSSRRPSAPRAPPLPA